MSDFEVIPAFATPLYMSNIQNLTEEERQYIMNVDFENGELYSVSNSKNVLNSPELANLKKIITENVNFYATEVLGIETKNDTDDFEFYIKTSWVLKTSKENPYIEHIHARSIISGVLYVNVDDKSGVINFRREYPNSTFTPYGFPVKHWNIYNSETYFIEPEIGKLVLFPSTIKHFMGNSESEIERYSLAFDVYIKGHLGKDKTSEIYYGENQ